MHDTVIVSSGSISPIRTQRSGFSGVQQDVSSGIEFNVNDIHGDGGLSHDGNVAIGLLDNDGVFSNLEAQVPRFGKREQRIISPNDSELNDEYYQSDGYNSDTFTKRREKYNKSRGMMEEIHPF